MKSETTEFTEHTEWRAAFTASVSSVSSVVSRFLVDGALSADNRLEKSKEA